MASDDIVQPVGGAPGVGPVGGGPVGASAEAVADASMLRPLPAGVRFATSAIGLVVGVICLLGAAGIAFQAPDYPPELVLAGMLAIAGLVVLPPVVGAARRVSPGLGSLWVPPLVFVLACVSASPLSKLAEPPAPERQAYIAGKLALADRALRTHDVDGADRAMFVARGDAKTNPAVQAMLARIDKERSDQAAAVDAQSAAANRPPSPAELNQAKLAELKRVDDAFNARDLACEKALDRFSARQDRIAAYDAAVDGDSACGDRFSQMPGEFSDAVPAPFRGKLNDDLKACENGYASLSYGMSKMARALDRDPRASVVSSALFELRSGRDQLIACRPRYEADLAAAGLQKGPPPAEPGAHKHRRHRG